MNLSGRSPLPLTSPRDFESARLRPDPLFGLAEDLPQQMLHNVFLRDIFVFQNNSEHNPDGLGDVRKILSFPLFQ